MLEKINAIIKRRDLKRKEALLFLIVFLVVSNIPPIKSLYGLFIDEGHYRFSNGNGKATWIDNQFKNDHYHLNPTVPKSFIEEFPGTTDTIVYRTFWRNPLAFWRWGEYFYDKRYKLPYKSWNEIRKRRPTSNYKTKWQDF